MMARGPGISEPMSTSSYSRCGIQFSVVGRMRRSTSVEVKPSAVFEVCGVTIDVLLGELGRESDEEVFVGDEPGG